MQDKENSTSFTTRILKPLLSVLMIFSLNRPCRKDSKKLILIFCIFTFLYIWLWIMTLWKVVACLIGAETIDDSSNNGLLIIGIICGFTTVSYFIVGMFYMPNRLKTFIAHCDELQNDPLFDISFQKLQRVVKYSIIIVLIVALSTLIGMVLTNISNSEFTCFFSPYKAGTIGYYVHISSIPVLGAVVIGQTCVIIVLVTVICTILKKHIKRCNEEFQKLCKSTPTVAMIERIRNRYFMIYQLSQHADSVLTCIIATIISMNFIIICLFANTFNFGSLGSTEVFTYPAIVCVCLSEITYIAVQCSLVNEKSKDCLETAVYLNGTKMGQEAISMVTLFIENIRSVDIGLTFMKLFIIDKQAIMSIYGTLLTYIIVVMQFKPS